MPSPAPRSSPFLPDPRPMRLFLALDPSSEEKERIRASIEGVSGAGFPLRWADPASYHITLKFLGEVRQDQLDPLRQAVERVAAASPPFDFTLGAIGGYPTLRRPQVVWMAVEAAPLLRFLKQDLEWALADLGFPREMRAFHPHITLARGPGTEGGGAFRGIDELAGAVRCEGQFRGDAVRLVRSHLSKDGARHVTLLEAPLAGVIPGGEG